MGYFQHEVVSTTGPGEPLVPETSTLTPDAIQRWTQPSS
jgi:hypothetical protein